LIADYHSSELFPERWFDFVFILRCGTTVLYDRLAARNYQQSKIQQNIECEIFGIVAEEAKEAYKEEIVHELSNETLEDRDKNIRTITELVAQHKRLR
jgi:adenylate kinase